MIPTPWIEAASGLVHPAWGAPRDFSGLAESGLRGPRAGTLRLLSFNVNGLRARQDDAAFLDYLLAESSGEPEGSTLLLLQELKVPDLKSSTLGNGFIDSFALLAPSSASVATSRPGVATFRTRSAARGCAARVPEVVRVTTDLPRAILNTVHPDFRGEFSHRIVTAWLGSGLNIILVNVYAPNGGKDGSSLPRREAWDAAFLAYVQELNRDGGASSVWPSRTLFSEPQPDWAATLSKFAGRIVIAGDLNVAGGQMDFFAAMPRIKTVAGTSAQEAAGFERLQHEGKVHDVWRERHPREVGFTWAHAHFGKKDNLVLARFDYVLVSTPIVDLVVDAQIRTKGAPSSDHMPLYVDLKWPLT